MGQAYPVGRSTRLATLWPVRDGATGIYPDLPFAGKLLGRFRVPAGRQGHFASALAHFTRIPAKKKSNLKNLTLAISRVRPRVGPKNPKNLTLK